MHCWAAQWAGQTKILGDKQTSEESLIRDDARIASSLASLVRDADVVVAHNSDQFDVPHLRNRLIVHQQEPLGPVATIDTLKVARKLGFSHNSLDALAKTLGIGAKTATQKDLWDQAFDGNELALQQMLRYCRNDVALLAQIFERLRPHATSLPRLVDGEGSFCPTCGSTHYQVRKYYRTKAGKQVQYQCQTCLSYFKNKTSDAGQSQMRPL
jgi:DNA polymerase III epsilon subunit-like protein